MAKQQGREMVEEARAYRERVLSELARRRELARQQIDQLIHGRDRLVQAFERARLVAADVVSELAPLQEPDEYVDLTPTTGPVPLTVPAGQLGDRSAVGDVRMPGELAFDDDDDDETRSSPTPPAKRRGRSSSTSRPMGAMTRCRSSRWRRNLTRSTTRPATPRRSRSSW